MFASSRRIETCIAWPWKIEVKIWPQVKVTAWPKLHISRSVLTRQTHWDHFHVSSSSQSQVIWKTCWWPRWPQTTLAGSLVNTWPWVIMNGLRAELGFGTFLVPAVSVFGTWKRVIRFSVFRYFRYFGHSVSVFRYFGIGTWEKNLYLYIQV